jgi:hypothetical protein
MNAITNLRSAPAATQAKQAPKRVADGAALERTQAQARAAQIAQARDQVDRVQSERRTTSNPPKEKGRYVDRQA